MFDEESIPDLWEYKRDIGACAIDRDDRGVLVGVGAIPGGIGGHCGEGENEWRGAGDYVR